DVVPVLRGALVLPLRARKEWRRRGGRLEVRHRKVEERLPRLRVPHCIAVANDHPLAVCRYADSRERLSRRELLAQLLEGAAHLALRDLRGRQLVRGTQEDQVVKTEPQLAAFAALRIEEPLGSVGTNLRGRQPEHRRD